ncbi:MAG: hypothetical protein JSV04_02090 [Candidatus Heimdallarchaeota archaeon]|nr:MAG: hypothetical protein JSV04_02090 [Candidatus Heimdallarchaeota archaeon]
MNRFHFLLPLLIITSSMVVPSINLSGYNSSTKNSHNSHQSRHNVGSSILKVLVVLIELPDDPHHPSHTVQFYEDLFFSSKPNTVRQYYQNTSYGEVLLEGDVLGWYQAENDLEYYGAGGRIENFDIRADSLVYEARTYSVEAGKDPQNYDLFVVINSGDGQDYSGNSDDIWPHRWTLHRLGLPSVEYSINHEYVEYITPSHELGHELYFPDLYDLQFEKTFAGPYCIMDQGEGHFSIWNKFYSQISRSDSAQLLSEVHRLQISNFSNDTFTTVNPIAIDEPSGIMWLELGWDATGFTNPSHGRGWTITVREKLDYDTYLPKHGVIIAKIQVGPRTSSTIQVSSEVSPPWDVIDAHPETSENKEDATFSLTDGDIGTFRSGEGWAIQLIERYENLSYRIRVTDETNIPEVTIIEPKQPVTGIYEILISAIALSPTNISLTEISIDNGPWQKCTFVGGSNYIFDFDTTTVREGTHLIRARAADTNPIPYIGYSPFSMIEVNNTEGKILVVDDDLGRSSEIPVLDALDELGYNAEYEIKRTSSLIETEITKEEMMEYESIIWIGNPAITPLSNSHINYNEFIEIKRYLQDDSAVNPPRIIFMSNYNIFDFSNQGTTVQDEIEDIFRAQSPLNFRAPVTILEGYDFLESLPPFTLGPTDSLIDNRSSDGEIVDLLPGAVSILQDKDPEYFGYSTKGYYVDTEPFKLVNYLFQPELVPSAILPQILNLTLNFLAQPTNTISYTSTTSVSQSNFSTKKTSSSCSTGMNPFIFSVLLLTGIFLYTRKKHFKMNR